MIVRRKAIDRWVEARIIPEPVAAAIMKFELDRWNRGYALVIKGLILLVGLACLATLVSIFAAQPTPDLAELLDVGFKVLAAILVVLLMIRAKPRPPALVLEIGVAAAIVFGAWSVVTLTVRPQPFVQVMELLMLIWGLRLISQEKHLWAAILAILYYMGSQYLGGELAGKGDPLRMTPLLLVPIVITPILFRLVRKIAQLLWKFFQIMDKNWLGRFINAVLARYLEIHDFIRDYIRQIGTVRLVLGLAFLSLVIFSWIKGQVPTLEDALVSSPNGYKVGMIGLWLVHLSLLPKERPGFSALICLATWLVVVPQVSRIGSAAGNAGFILTLEGTRYNSGKVLMAILFLAAFRSLAIYLTRSKRPVRELIQLGPMGSIAMVLLLALS